MTEVLFLRNDFYFISSCTQDGLKSLQSMRLKEPYFLKNDALICFFESCTFLFYCSASCRALVVASLSILKFVYVA